MVRKHCAVLIKSERSQRLHGGLPSAVFALAEYREGGGVIRNADLLGRGRSSLFAGMKYNFNINQ
jgi:hypothetical protein